MQTLVIILFLSVGIGLSRFFVLVIREGWESYKRGKQYSEAHPPISDEEFLRLCGPDVDPMIALKVRAIISEQLCLKKEDIYPDTTWEDLGAY